MSAVASVTTRISVAAPVAPTSPGIAPGVSVPVHVGFEMDAPMDLFPGSTEPLQSKLAFNLDAPTAPNAASQFKFSALAPDGTKLIDIDQPIVQTPVERAAATGIFQALAGSALLQRSVPFSDTKVNAGSSRMTFTMANGDRRMVVEANDSPDLPEDAAVQASFGSYIDNAKLQDIIGSHVPQDPDKVPGKP